MDRFVYREKVYFIFRHAFVSDDFNNTYCKFQLDQSVTERPPERFVQRVVVEISNLVTENLKNHKKGDYSAYRCPPDLRV